MASLGGSSTPLKETTRRSTKGGPRRLWRGRYGSNKTQNSKLENQKCITIRRGGLNDFSTRVFDRLRSDDRCRVRPARHAEWRRPTSPWDDLSAAELPGASRGHAAL